MVLVEAADATATRLEKDSMGTKAVPAQAYYGVQALRGKENFTMLGLTASQAYPDLIKAFGWVKKAAAKANMELGLLDAHNPEHNRAVGQAIMDACDELIAGQFNAEYIVDVFQGGTGTSNHMNTNEILGNRATELLGGKKGEYLVHPNDHVNYGQSTNDVTPTVMRLTVLSMHPPLMDSVNLLATTLRKKAAEFSAILIPGRTHMQDAVPLTMGQVFGGYAYAIERVRDGIAHAIDELHAVGLGASALGTGLNTHPDYRPLVTRYLGDASGFPIRQTHDYFYATSSLAPFVAYSGALRNLAVELEKIAHDFKLYSSGPKTAIGELKLPDLQPGSSIMPGKVNPVLPELMDQLSYAVQGNDATIALCGQNGQWQLNVMMPLTILKLSESMRLLTNGLRLFAQNCVDGLAANTDMCEQRMEKSTILLTALNPYIGYEKAALIAKRVLGEGKTVRQVVLEDKLTDNTGKLLTEDYLNQILSVEAMTQPRHLINY
jgi:aspartate ammonia-lyase